MITRSSSTPLSVLFTHAVLTCKFFVDFSPLHEVLGPSIFLISLRMSMFLFFLFSAILSEPLGQDLLVTFPDVAN